MTAVYWGRLYSGTWFAEMYGGWSNVSQHGLNSAFALFEILIPRTDPPPPVHMLWLIILLAMYLALAYVTEASRGFYPYDFLDPGQQGGLVAAYVFGIALGCIVVFGLVWAAVWLRKYITETKLGKDGQFGSAAGRSAGLSDMEMAKPQETTVA